MSMNLKNQLRLYLRDRGITASQLARKTSVPKQSISGWLAGNNPRDVRQVKRVAEVFGVSLDQLLFGNGIIEPKQDPITLDQLVGKEWIGGLFEVRLRRVTRRP